MELFHWIGDLIALGALVLAWINRKDKRSEEASADLEKKLTALQSMDTSLLKLHRAHEDHLHRLDTDCAVLRERIDHEIAMLEKLDRKLDEVYRELISSSHQSNGKGHE